MGAQTGIEWTDATVNFWWGCTKVSPGCDHCYAETLSRRFGEHWGVGAPRRKIKSAVALLHRLDNRYAEWAADHYCAVGNAPAFGLPHPGTQPRQRVFIQSMSDLFDTEVPDEWFREAWETIESCNRLTLQILTKRISVVEKRLAAIGRTQWPAHAGLMITVVNQDEADRDIPRLLALKVKLGIPWVGLSIEPMLGAVDIRHLYGKITMGESVDVVVDALAGRYKAAWHGRETPVRHDDRACAPLDWIIVGGESGPGARPMHPDWARSIRDQCKAAGVPFFFKQWGEWAPEEIVSDQGPSKHWRAWHDGQFRLTDDIPNSAVGESHTVFVARVGKKAAGDLLDGVQHREMPQWA